MRAAFREIVDYAGLFPPAECTMVQAARQYDTYRRSSERWMLGRFVLAASRLMELGAAVESAGLVLDSADPWRLSVVLAANVPDDLSRIEGFRLEWEGRGLLADAVERRITTAGEVMYLGDTVPPSFARFFEPPHEGPYPHLLGAIARIGAFAKIRTGGIDPESFPSPANLTAFLKTATDLRVRFKATAGLHHPFRGEYPLTYKPGSARFSMYGFVNLLLATTELLQTHDDATAQRILEEDDPSAFERDARAISWRGHRYGVEELMAAREHAFVAFGSCSFREPVDELGLGAAA